MTFRKMTSDDIKHVVKIYINYYNEQEERCWTEERATKRIRQIFSIEDSCCLVAEEGEEIIAFVIGFFRQYDDLVSYYLDEIVVATKHQNKGVGSALLEEVKCEVKKCGAAGIELYSVNDEKHDHFYGKAQLKNSSYLLPKVFWFD